MKKRVLRIMLVCAMIVALAFTPAWAGKKNKVDAEKMDVEDEALAFDASSGETFSVLLDGESLNITKYLVTYVAYPIEMDVNQPGYGPSGYQGDVQLDDVYCYQKMFIYVSGTAAEDQDAAIILRVNNGGWRTSAVNDAIMEDGEYVSTSDEDSVGAALKAGYVIVSAGTRSRGALSADGLWAGKAPAVVVDAKAAIRYLKLNDKIMPGSADRIVITGGSGGGGLSTAVAASGNSADYYPYLQEIGAAGINSQGKSTLTDDVFAIIAYCPITDLGNADIAYEWQYGATRLISEDYTSGGSFSESMKEASEALAAQYPSYLASLGLKLSDGRRLNADTMPDAIMEMVKVSVEEAMANGEEVPDLGEDWTFSGWGGDTVVTNEWLDVDNDTDTVVSTDYDKYLECVCKTSALKTVPAFDATGVTGTTVLSGENSLFGADDTEYSNFMQWAWDNNEIAGDDSGYDDTGLYWDEYVLSSELDNQIKLINPIAYLIDRKNGVSAPYWYVRHGMRDRDTSFAVEVELFLAIANDPTVKDANYKLTYFKGHGGGDDVQEAYGWLAEVLAEEHMGNR
ncbi:MAG: subtype B tannase [Desulfobacteraceae bacterium]